MADKMKNVVLAILNQEICEIGVAFEIMTHLCSEIKEDLLLQAFINIFKDNKEFASVKNYYESIIPRYNDLDFKSHFRMSRHSIEQFLNTIQFENDSEKTSVTIPPMKKILMTLWYLGTQESYRQIADRFGMRKSSAHFVVISTVNNICSQKFKFIHWPAPHQYEKIAEAFKARRNFPGVIGAIDGSYIHCKPPKNGREAFINRKGFPSIILQAVCDANKIFIDVFADRAGSVHDARIFRISPLGRTMLENPHFIPAEYHLLGDSAYPCRTDLLTPFHDNGHLSQLEKNYNFAHSTTRVVIEHAFGIMKSKFRRLKYVDKTRVDLVPNTIIACCCLHNFIIINDKESNSDDDYCDNEYDDYFYEKSNNDCNLGKLKRNTIMNQLA